jgi:hypothetical protein
MDEMKYTLLEEVLGRWRADVIENFLKSKGIDVVLIEGTVTDLFTPTFAIVKIYVRKEDLGRSRELLKEYNKSQEDA